MKFLVVLALCFAAVSALECDSCDLDGAWRVSLTTENNDDEAYQQWFDGQVDWHQKWTEFLEDEREYQLGGRDDDDQRRETALESCREALPDRIYNVRWERLIDDLEYDVRTYIYRGFIPEQGVWDTYCDKRISPSTAPDPFPFVETEGRSIGALKGAYGQAEQGNIQGVNGCRVRFRPKAFESRCLIKNDDRTFPTLDYSQMNARAFLGVSSGPICSVTAANSATGQRSLARYGCNQYTWDSDTNDDNIERNCDRMYFVNEFDRPENLLTFQPGQEILEAVEVYDKEGSAATPITPGANCEYRVGGVGWGNLAGFNSHPCQ